MKTVVIVGASTVIVAMLRAIFNRGVIDSSCLCKANNDLMKGLDNA